MTKLNPEHLNAAAVTYREAEALNGSGAYHDNVEAAVIAYQQATVLDEFRKSIAEKGAAV